MSIQALIADQVYIKARYKHDVNGMMRAASIFPYNILLRTSPGYIVGQDRPTHKTLAIIEQSLNGDPLNPRLLGFASGHAYAIDDRKKAQRYLVLFRRIVKKVR